MSLSWLRQWVMKPVRASDRKSRRIDHRPRYSVPLALETLEERCLLDAGLGGVASGLRNVSFIYDMKSQIQTIQDPSVIPDTQHRAEGYLFSDIGSLVGNIFSSLPGADSKTIGQAITTASDFGRLASLLLTNGLKNTNAQQAAQDFQLARSDLYQAGAAYSGGSLAQRNILVTKANDLDTKGGNLINENPNPSQQPVTTALNEMYLLNNDAAFLPDPRTGPDGLIATEANFQAQKAAVFGASPPWSAAGISTAIGDVLALAGDVSTLAGAPPIVGDLLGTAHDALAVGTDIANGDDPTSDLLSLGADANTLVNDLLPAPNPTSQPLSVSMDLPGSNSPTVGANFAGNVATFHDPNAASPASAYTAYITWGDGSSSLGQIVSNGNGNFTIAGEHFFVSPASYPVSVVVAGNGTQGQAGEQVAVNATPGGTPTAFQGITVVGQNITTPGTQTVSGTVATIYAPAAGTYTATIDWGDGNTSTGQIVGTGNGIFAVTGSHTYTLPDSTLTSVQVSDSSGNLASAFGMVSIGAPPPSPPASPPPGGAPPASPPAVNPAPNNPAAPNTSPVAQIFAQFQHIVAQIQAEIQQIISIELKLEQEVLTLLAQTTKKL